MTGQAISFEAGGRSYELRFSTNAFCKAEELLGFSIMKLEDEISFSTIRVLLLCGLTWADRTLSTDKAGKILDEALMEEGQTFEDMFELITKAIENAMPTREEEEHPARKNRRGGKKS